MGNRVASGARGLLPAAFLLFGGVACAATSDSARARAAREYDCPESKVTVKWLSSADNGDIYRVNACGTVATYSCDDMSGNCIKESDDRRSRDAE